MMPISQSSVATPWWVKIDTSSPRCTYFFGPFESSSEAQLHRSGYFDDLFAEGAEGIDIAIEQDDPKVLTIDEDEHLLVPFPSVSKARSVERSLSLVS